MNNPFFYSPSPECIAATQELTAWLEGKPSPFSDTRVDDGFKKEIAKGKMFGVLVVDGNDDLTRGRNVKYIAGYSGQICGRADWDGFVPAVFDYLQPDGYFKRHEAEITQLNKDIKAQASHIVNIDTARQQEHAVDERPSFVKGKREGESDSDYVSRRQFENAELHRWKLRQREAERIVTEEKDRLTSLKTLRRQKSDDLQRWLFHHFRMLNSKGESKDLIEIRGGDIPPAGSGECCEPRLLQYAFQHGLTPKSMAMFWWGESPKGEVRHHLHFYPACNGKCKPILKWMLQGMDVDANPLESGKGDDDLAARLQTIYDDNDICIVCKPAGLLSVPGKSKRESVLSIMRQRFPDSPSPLIVHRLDMATSGLMIIAKTMQAYHDLQRQFASHEIRKRYVAVLSHPLPDDTPKEGVISLPMRPDLNDRPRQVIDHEHGHEAITYYKQVDTNRLWLWPRTGRTHQLRLHCAHQLGLADPIKGDTLYGTNGDRLYLHAEAITFRHPTTGKVMTFTKRATF